MIEVPLTKGYVALVDDDDAALVLPYKWYAAWSRNTGSWYAARSVTRSTGRTTVFLHRVILNANPTQFVDHINHDTLDCRRHNLRLSSAAQNCHNRKRQRDTLTGVTGVRLDRSRRTKRYRVDIVAHGIKHYIGRFHSLHEALAARIAAEEKYFGEFAPRREQEQAA